MCEARTLVCLVRSLRSSQVHRRRYADVDDVGGYINCAQGASIKSTESGWSVTQYKPSQSLVDYSISDDEKEQVSALPPKPSVEQAKVSV